MMNKVRGLADLIGVEINKPFRLIGLNGKPLSYEYVLYNSGLYRRPIDKEKNYAWEDTKATLFLILQDMLKVEAIDE